MKARKVEAILKKNGFVCHGNRTGHGMLYVHHIDGKRSTTIGQHYPGGVIPAGTLKSIERQTNLTF